MTKDEAVEELLDSFPVLYYYIRLNPKLQSVTAVKDKGRFVKGQTIDLKARDFSALWLIGLLTKREQGGCMQSLLCDLVEWKHPSDRDKPRKRFGEDVLDGLEAAGFICGRDRKHPLSRKSVLVELTGEGASCLAQLRLIRRDNVARLLELLQLSGNEEFDAFAEGFNRIAETAWERIRQEARNDESNLN